jgi:alpha-N-arabinofuranosidase
MLEPESGVVMANYWQFLNGYWGFLRGPEAPPADVRWSSGAVGLLYRLWGGHVGTRLVAAEVTGVAGLDFEGYKQVAPAHGEGCPARVLGSWPLEFTPGSRSGATLVSDQPGSATIALRGLHGKQYASMPAFAVAGGQLCRLRWEQRVEPPTPGFTPGLGLGDARGWNATHSGCGGGPGRAPDADGWATLEAEMRTLPDATAVTGVVRLEAGDQPITATVRFRNATVTRLSPTVAPAYAPITVHASLAADGRTLHLVVFNKHHDRDQPMQVRLADASARSARAWCVSGPFAATDLDPARGEEVREILGGRTVCGVAADGFAFTFPARSMTAIDIAR